MPRQFTSYPVSVITRLLRSIVCTVNVWLATKWDDSVPSHQKVASSQVSAVRVLVYDVAFGVSATTRLLWSMVLTLNVSFTAMGGLTLPSASQGWSSQR